MGFGRRGVRAFEDDADHRRGIVGVDLVGAVEPGEGLRHAAAIALVAGGAIVEIDRCARPHRLVVGRISAIARLGREASETAINVGWTTYDVGQIAGNRSSFDVRNFGFKSLSDMFKQLPEFKIERRDGKHYYVKRLR